LESLAIILQQLLVCLIFTFSCLGIGSNGLYSQIILILPCWIYVTFFFKTTFRKREAEKLSLEKVEASIIGKKKGDASGLLLPVDEGLLQERLLN